MGVFDDIIAQHGAAFASASATASKGDRDGYERN